MRTGGAVLLASMGLDTTRIEAMARWNSPMLLYYIRSAPLKSITSEFKLLDASRSSPSAAGSATTDDSGNRKLLKVVADLIARLDKAESLKDSFDSRLTELERSAAPARYIMNCSSGVWHLSRDHIAGKPCYTACGWHYTGLHFEAVVKLPAEIAHKMMCGTCMPAQRLLASLD